MASDPSKELKSAILSSRGTFPILSGDPSFQETTKNTGEMDLIFKKRTMAENNGEGRRNQALDL